MSQLIEDIGANRPEVGEGTGAEPEQPLAAAGQPTFRFFGIVASVSLALDVGSKAWAALTLENRLEPVVLIDKHLTFTWALNRGGAWGILQDAGEMVRKPFFFIVSVLAITFIVSLYSRLLPGQRALKWGLPLVLGGALGNLADRIVRGSVIDFIDYRADWVLALNTWVKRYSESWSVTDHWPTFNVADISICIGVLLMAVDMVTSRRGPTPPARLDSAKPESQATPEVSAEAKAEGSAPPAEPSGEPAAEPDTAVKPDPVPQTAG